MTDFELTVKYFSTVYHRQGAEFQVSYDEEVGKKREKHKENSWNQESFTRCRRMKLRASNSKSSQCVSTLKFSCGLEV